MKHITAHFNTSSQSSRERGVGALLVVVILGGVLLLLAVSASESGIGQLSRSLGDMGSAQARALARGCLEDQLRIFVMNPSDTGGNVSVPEGTCILSVSGGATKDLLVTATTPDGYAVALRAAISISGNAPASVTTLHATYESLP